MEETQDGEVLDTEMEKASDTEAAIKSAMRARVGDFKVQADSLTLEGVRRLLEKDLKLEKLALDVHKRFIKQCLEECFDVPNDEISKTSGENVEEVGHSDEKSTTKLVEGLQPKKEAEINSKDEKKEGSPVLGLLREGKQHEDTQTTELEEVPSEGTIKKAIKKRAGYFRENSEQVTLVGARRLLEEDLGLDKYALDSHKKFISDQLDEVLHGSEVAQSANGIKKKTQNNKVSKKVSRTRSSDSSDEEVDDDDIKAKKKITPKGKSGNSEVAKSRKRPAPEIKSSSNKRKKPVEPTSGESSDEKDGNLSENGQSQSSADEPVKKKKEVSTQAYGKQVEHLKSIIKACGLSITPSVYKKVKQAPENKRESYLIKELEDILGREGLSTNPSEKEMKSVKRRKEREKELEGIDMSNIVASSRRRPTTSYMAPLPKPKISVESDGNDDKKNDNEDDTDDDDDDSSSEGTSEGLDEDVEDEND
ncbi:HIRA-interacting protein 3-like [Macadamia integrifolia]|uniref:HIRA-interacting protein 3-like n=1 Tax=Macadamia integrifolia TaxID=60698 RepID=UPI001C4FD633|nr:HIRA-interacting protein 3-like [Macadamia integrifolia]